MKSREVCEKLGITKMTLHNYVKSGKIKVKARYSRKMIIYDDASVEKLLSEQWTEEKDQNR